MGGTKIVQPSPPSQPTAGESAREYAAALPDILAAQLKYQPQFDRQTFESFAELGPEFARVSREVLNEYSPTLASLDEELAGQALDLSQQGLTDEQRDLYRDQFKSLVGEQAGSGIGADFVAKNLLAQDIAQRQYGQNLGLSLQGKVPIAQAVQQPSNFQVASSFMPAYQTQSSTFGSIFSGAGRPIATKGRDYLGGAGGLLTGIGGLGSLGGSEGIRGIFG